MKLLTVYVRCLNQIIVFAFLACVGVSHSEGADSDVRYGSPQEAFEAYQKAMAAKDARSVERCLSEEALAEFLFDFLWTGADGNDRTILEKHLDRKTFNELVSKRIPVSSSEARQVFVESLHNTTDTLQDLLDVLPEQQKQYYSSGRVSNVREDGDRARGEVRFGESSGAIEYCFVKQKDSWRFDVSKETRERSEQKVEPVETKAWTGKDPPSFDSPEAVWKALQKSLEEADPESMWHCFTDDHRERLFVESVFLWIADAGVMECYLDPKKLQPPDDESTGTGEAARAKLILDAIIDRKVYFTAIVKRQVQIQRDRKELPEPLRNVVVEGDRAEGTVTEYIRSVQSEPGKPPVENRSPYPTKSSSSEPKMGGGLVPSSPLPLSGTGATSSAGRERCQPRQATP